MAKQVNLDVKQLRSIHIFCEDDGAGGTRYRLIGEYELTDDNGSVLYSRQIEIMPDATQQNKIDALYARLPDAAQDQEGVKPKIAKTVVAVAARTKTKEKKKRGKK